MPARERRRTAWALPAVVLGVIVVALFYIQGSRERTAPFLFLLDWGGGDAGASAARPAEEPLPVPRAAEIDLDRARVLLAQGHPRDALRLLDRIGPTIRRGPRRPPFARTSSVSCSPSTPGAAAAGRPVEPPGGPTVRSTHEVSEVQLPRLRAGGPLPELRVRLLARTGRQRARLRPAAAARTSRRGRSPTSTSGDVTAPGAPDAGVSRGTAPAGRVARSAACRPRRRPGAQRPAAVRRRCPGRDAAGAARGAERAAGRPPVDAAAGRGRAMPARAPRTGRPTRACRWIRAPPPRTRRAGGRRGERQVARPRPEARRGRPRLARCCSRSTPASCTSRCVLSRLAAGEIALLPPIADRGVPAPVERRLPRAVHGGQRADDRQDGRSASKWCPSTEGPLTVGRALVRVVALLAQRACRPGSGSCPSPSIGAHRGLHDRLAKTRVVRTAAS